ncbi:MAG TPA: hypothetical protein VJN18_05940 [Polyangiaceae bacterium]|nr:hypothetical protein [Polyangiaceae bacterium]
MSPSGRKALQAPGRAWLLAAIWLSGCRDQSAAPIRIVAGPQATDQVTLVPRASLAEYIEVSPNESALLLTLSSVERSCESSPDPQGDALGLTIRVVLPGPGKLTPGRYPSIAEAQREGRAYALPTVKLRGRRTELRPGGELELRELDLTPRGSVSGLLKFEFPGDAEHPATRVSGRFSARFCRVSRLRD